MANAQCAWVLWEKSNISPSPDWQIISAFPKYEQCIERQESEFNKIKELYKIAKITILSPETMLIELGIGEPYRYTSKCLPGTIDPRK
jgi:hypothetical protein